MENSLREEVTSLLPEHTFDRRAFLVSSLAAGFALAVQPVSAQTITTDSNGLVAGEVSVPASDGQIPAYRAMPNQAGPFPTVLVVHEIFGVHEHIKDICRRLAKVGYFAIAPALYARQGDVSKIASINEIVDKVVSKVPDAQVMSDLDATVAYCKTSGKADTGKLGVTGFCWGGRIVWLYAAHSAALKAAVAWYGPLARPTTSLAPTNPIDLVKELKAPVLGLYGGQDQGITQDIVEKMRAALKDSGKTAEIVVYPDAPHGFNADYRPSYRKADAEDGWNRLLGWFRKYGVS